MWKGAGIWFAYLFAGRGQNGMSQNYHITLDSSAVGLERGAEIIVGIALDQEQIF